MRPRRWFRFSLRTIFVLLTVFGVWLGVQAKWIGDRRAALSQIQDGAGYIVTDSSGYHAPPWQIRLLGAQSIDGIVVHRLKDADARNMQDLKRLFPEADVSAYP